MLVAVVTGASSGIGAATAARLLREGWAVAVVGRRGERLRAAAAAGPTDAVLPVTADLTRDHDIMAAAARIRAWQPRLDALVHAAGDFLVAPMGATSASEFERLWRLTVAARFLLTKELAAALAPAPPGFSAIVHVGSLATHRDFPDECAYMSAMYGVTGLARAQDVELRPRRIRAALVSPGLVRTELTRRANFAEADLNRALDAGAIATSIVGLIAAIRGGSYIPEIFQTPSAMD